MKFQNTQQKHTLENFMDSYQEQLKSPFMTSTNINKSIEVTFFNIDELTSTLDPDSKIYYSSHGKESPLDYVKISNLLIYNYTQIEAQLENGEFGLESGNKEGEAIIPPDTIVPIPGSFFFFNKYPSVGIFKVTDANVDTIENGYNFWHIEYRLDRHDIHMLDNQVSREYIFMADNAGTKLNPMILKSDYNLLEKINSVLNELSEYYKSLFYSSRVDTFIFEKDGKLWYDPYLIEFLKRNSLNKHFDKYMYINQQVSLPLTFEIEYNDTIFKALEKNKLKDNMSLSFIGRGVVEPLSILYMRSEDYLETKYVNNYNKPTIHDYVTEILSTNFIDCCKQNRKFEDNNKYMNIIIKYFNNEEIVEKDLHLLDEINYVPEMHLFYEIPMILFILDKAMTELMT